MHDEPLDPRLVDALREHSRAGLRRIDAVAIAEAAVGRAEGRRRVVDTLHAPRWLTQLHGRDGSGRQVLAMTVVAVMAVAGIGLMSSMGGGPGASLPLPSAIGTARTSPSPTVTPPPSADPTLELTVDGLLFSVRLPDPKLGHGWETFGNLLVSKSITGPQGAEAVVFWAGFPDGIEADPCINAPIDLWTTAEVADFIASAPGTSLVTAPQDVTVGGYPAKHVVVVVRGDDGCDPGFFYTWKAQTGGALWVKSLPGDTIRVWVVQVGSQLVFIAGETHRDTIPGVPLTERAKIGLEQEIQQIVDSIRFE